ncbi:MAG: DUF3426 domain-containing protein [Xanthobacteraceae bacterium]
MLIVCPSCATSYNINQASLGPGGRTVRCARCRNSWHAGGPETQQDHQGFVNDVIAEAEAQHAAPPSPPPRPPAAAAPPPADPPHAPDDFGAEPTAPTDTPATDGDAAAAGQWPAADEPPPAGIDHRGPVAPPQPVSDAPSIVPPAGHAPLRRTPSVSFEPEDVEDFAARRERLKVKRTKKQRASKWTALVLVLLGFNIALIGARNEVVRYLPQTASLFSMIGLPVNLRNLSFENVKVVKEEADGTSVLLIEGEIVNTAGSPVEVPRLRFAVRNVQGQEIYAWTALATRSAIAPGERLPFRSRLASPPADASDVMVRFFTARDATAGAK